MNPNIAEKPVNADDESPRQFGNGWRTARDRIRSSLSNPNPPTKDGAQESATEQAEDEQRLPSPLVDPELHRLITEWRVSRTRESYKPYSEAELRKFGQQWKVGSAKYAPSEEEVREKLNDLQLIHTSLDRVTDKFYELSWTRNTQDYWHHIWLTLHLAGATVEEVWEITRNKWPKLLKEMKPFGPREVEKLENFIEISGGIVLRCDLILSEFDAEHERTCCAKLYRVLRAFPIAPRWKCTTSWEAQDRYLRQRADGLLNRLFGWF
ncbi:hypothetical protein F5Y08DRAFT_299808 [Xylaria arbuscula]|nr:hypothetical protein F5Y08DRAFT_299808 [Xylaria arbuscula]